MKIKSIEQLEKEYEKASEKCVDNAYDTDKEDWNPEHFQYCEGDILARWLDQTNAILELMDKIELKKGDWCDAWFELKDKIRNKKLSHNTKKKKVGK